MESERKNVEGERYLCKNEGKEKEKRGSCKWMRKGWGNSWKGRRKGRERKLEADEKEKGRKLERKGRGKLGKGGGIMRLFLRLNQEICNHQSLIKSSLHPIKIYLYIYEEGGGEMGWSSGRGDLDLTDVIPMKRDFFAALYQHKNYPNYLCQSWYNAAKFTHTNNR